MADEPVCLYTIARYVADPRRDEAKNIGALVICPERSYAGSRFMISRAHVKAGSPRHRMLAALQRSHRLSAPGLLMPDLFGRAMRDWGREELEALHRECTNLVQFTQPLPFIGEPSQVLGSVFQEFVAPRTVGGRPSWTSRRAARTFADVFEAHHVNDWLHETPTITTKQGAFDFDLAVGIGDEQWNFVIEALSFRKEALLHVEQAGAWFAHVWPIVHSATGAKGILIAEPPANGRQASERYGRVCEWAQQAEIEVYGSDEASVVAEQIAKQLPEPALRRG